MALSFLQDHSQNASNHGPLPPFPLGLPFWPFPLAPLVTPTLPSPVWNSLSTGTATVTHESDLSADTASTSSQITKPRVIEEEVEAFKIVDRIGESARNRFGRPYISGRPLLLCDRQKIIRLHREGRRKITIAREIGVTHSCVSKVIRRFEETGMLESKNSRTASCACPGDAANHDLRVCRHARFIRLPPSSSSSSAPKYSQLLQPKVADNENENDDTTVTDDDPAPVIGVVPTRFSIEWILSDHCG